MEGPSFQQLSWEHTEQLKGNLDSISLPEPSEGPMGFKASIPFCYNTRDVVEN